MTPGFFFHKSLLEGMNVYNSDFDDEDQFFVIEDEDNDDETTGDALGAIDGAGAKLWNADEADNNFSIEDVDADGTPGKANKKASPRKGRKSKKEEPAPTKKNDGCTRAETRDLQLNAGMRELYSRIFRISDTVVKAYTEQGMREDDPAIHELRVAESDQRSPEAVLNALEKLGIAAKKQGYTLGDACRGVVPPDIISTIFFLEIPATMYGKDDFPIISDKKAAATAVKISANVAGLASSNGVPYCKADGNLYNYLKDDGKTIGTDAAVVGSSKVIREKDLSNAQVSAMDNPPKEAASFYMVPTPIYEAIRASLAEDPVFATGYNLDDLAAEVMFLGIQRFSEKYQYSTKLDFFSKIPSLKVRANLSSSCYATYNGNKLTAPKKLVEYLLHTIVRFCIPGQPGMIFDSRHNPMPKLGKEWYDIMTSSKPTAVLTNPSLIKAAKEGYLYQLNMDGEYKHIFKYFVTTSTLMSSDAMGTTTGEDEKLSTEHILTAGKEYSDAMMDSGDEKTKMADAAVKQILSSRKVATLFRKLDIEMPDVDNEQPVVNMKRMTAFLVTVSKILGSKLGVKSTITSADGIHPEVHYDSMENISRAKCPIVGIWKQAAGVELANYDDPEIHELFSNVPVYTIVETFFRWLNTIAGEIHLEIEDNYRNLFVDDTWEQAREAFTPEIRMTGLIADLLKKMKGNLPACMLNVVRRYAIKESASMGINFLTDAQDLMDLLQYIMVELHGITFTDTMPDNLVDMYNRYLDKIVNWNVQLGPNGKPAKLVPPGEGRGTQLISCKPNHVLEWVRSVLMGYNNATEVVPIIMGFIHYASEMSGGGERSAVDAAYGEYDSSTLNGLTPLSGGADEFRGELGVTLDTAIDRYDPDTRGKSLYEMISYAAGDDGTAIRTIDAIAKLTEPLTDDYVELNGANADLSEEGVKHAVEVLNATNGINFPELVM